MFASQPDWYSGQHSTYSQRGNKHFAAYWILPYNKTRTNAYSTAECFKSLLKAMQRRNKVSSEIELSCGCLCCSYKSIRQPLTISDLQAFDSVSTCCRSSRHLPGNADVLEEKHELNKAFGFCHHSYVVSPLQGSALVFSRCFAICWAAEMLRPPQSRGSQGNPTP